MNNWEQILTDTGALWRHDGNPTRPHALLASGKHSDGYSNGSYVIEQPGLLIQIVEAMRERIAGELVPLPAYVVGPAMGAVAIGYEMARQLGVRFIFTEPKETPEGKIQVLKRFEIPVDSRVLIVEDMVTTGGSILSTVHALEAVGASVMPVVPVILDRTNGVSYDVGPGRHIVPLVTLSIQSWEAHECPLCALGSEALPPKAYWKKFTA